MWLPIFFFFSLIYRSLEESSYLEIRRDGTITEWAVRRGVPVQITHVRSRSRMCDSESADSYSPPQPFKKSERDVDTNSGTIDSDPIRTSAQDELHLVFSPQLAHLVYIPFFRFLGESVVEQALKNHLLIQDLCFEYEQEMQHAARSGSKSERKWMFLSRLKKIYFILNKFFCFQYLMTCFIYRIIYHHLLL